MTYGYIKTLKNRIHKLNAKIAVLEDVCSNLSLTLSQVPGSKSSQGNRLQLAIEEKVDLERERDELREKMKEAKGTIPQCYEGDLIRMKVRGSSWKSIAREVTGDEKDSEAIRKMCTRFKW